MVPILENAIFGVKMFIRSSLAPSLSTRDLPVHFYEQWERHVSLRNEPKERVRSFAPGGWKDSKPEMFNGQHLHLIDRFLEKLCLYTQAR